MIQLEGIEVRGESDLGPFGADVPLIAGLQVITARNAFGKSIAAKAVAWCLGLEPMLGVQDNDTSCFPIAVREEVELERGIGKVRSSECSITLRHADSRQLRLSRAIKGNPSTIRVEERGADGSVRTSILAARVRTMQDEHGGFQRFLFTWLGWPRAQVATFKGTVVDVYLENLAPLFYIEQDEGWTDIQARQIGRYAQQQIGQVAVEFLLGATDAITQRLSVQAALFRSAELRTAARSIAEQVNNLLARNGWNVEWSGRGTVAEIVSRWSAATLTEVLRDAAAVDLTDRVSSLRNQLESAREALTTEPIDPTDVSSHAQASQAVIELKQKLHSLAEEMRTSRGQSEQVEELLESLGHRLQAAGDVLRLKTTGVGRLVEVECPTCHRYIDPRTFELTEQSVDGVRAHIESLKRDRDLMKKNRDGIARRLVTLQSEAEMVSLRFRDAERSLMTVTDAVGPVRERLAQAAARLASIERELDAVTGTAAELGRLEVLVARWLAEAQEMERSITSDTDTPRRVEVFKVALREHLLALGHSAVTSSNAMEVSLDDSYVPVLGRRRLQSLGSASDRSRLIAAYSLALAAASRRVKGFHPGLVILDEPLQQNPDEPHRELFAKFLSGRRADDEEFQTVIFTYLRATEVGELAPKNIVITPSGEHLLRSVE